MALCLAAACCAALPAFAGTIPAAHVYHHHMPNFWPFYAVDVQAKYNATAIGDRAPVRYLYDGEVPFPIANLETKKNPTSLRGFSLIT